MMKVLRFAALALFLAAAPTAKSQSISNVVEDTLFQGVGSMDLTIIGSGTNFLSGITGCYLYNGSDTIYPYMVSTPTTVDSVVASFDIGCNYPEGTYNLYFSDNNDGPLILNNAIELKSGFHLYPIVHMPTCMGASDGYIESGLWGGGRGGMMYDITWYPGLETTIDLFDIPAGSYSVAATDMYSQCYDSVSVVVQDPPFFDVQTGKIDADCGMQNGLAYVSYSGGVPPYNVGWNDESTTDTVYNLSPGTYSVQVYDDNGCSRNFGILISAQLTIDVSSTSALCGTDASSATATVLNGSGPFTYLWSNGDTSVTADSLGTGQYLVQASDATGCTGSQFVNITATNGPVISNVNTIAPTCGGFSNGTIDITVTGGTSPYSFGWSTGTTSEDLTGVSAGTYEVTVTDATGCSDIRCIMVAEGNAPVFDYYYGNDAWCGINNGSAEAYTYGGTYPVQIQWDFNTGNQTGNTAYGLYAGFYSVVATDANGCTDSVVVAVSNSGSPEAYYDSLTTAHCGSNDGAIYLSTTNGTPPYNFAWSNGTSNEDLTGVDNGTYLLNITDANFCQRNQVWVVEGFAPDTQTVCIVTVDTLTGMNLVVWEKPVVTNIDHYNIYRESCGDIAGYVYVGQTPYDSLSEFIDPGANAMVRSWKYRITSVDECGTESNVSAYHKTIHLAVNRNANNDANLSWDSYIGFSYTEQYVWRHHYTTGWQIIDTLAANIHAYTDNAPFTVDSVEYFIEVYSPFPCTSTRATNHNSTRSNRSTVAAPNNSSITEYENSFFSVYPNPSDGIFNLNFNVATAGSSQICVYDLSGRIVKSQSLNVNSGANNYQLNLESLTPGMYHITITNGTQVIKSRIVKH